MVHFVVLGPLQSPCVENKQTTHTSPCIPWGDLSAQWEGAGVRVGEVQALHLDQHLPHHVVPAVPVKGQHHKVQCKDLEKEIKECLNLQLHSPIIEQHFKLSVAIAPKFQAQLTIDPSKESLIQMIFGQIRLGAQPITLWFVSLKQKLNWWWDTLHLSHPFHIREHNQHSSLEAPTNMVLPGTFVLCGLLMPSKPLSRNWYCANSPIMWVRMKW